MNKKELTKLTKSELVEKLLAASRAWVVMENELKRARDKAEKVNPVVIDFNALKREAREYGNDLSDMAWNALNLAKKCPGIDDHFRADIYEAALEYMIEHKSSIFS